MTPKPRRSSMTKKRGVSDRERLDWLTKFAWGVAFNTDRNTYGKWRCHVGANRDGLGETPRQAIDAAIKAARRKNGR